MRTLFLIAGITCWCICMANAQQAEVLNKYKSVFVPPLSYGKDKNDIYGIRQATIEKLTGSGVPLFLDEHEISRTAFKDPCAMLHCLVNNTSSPEGKNRSLVYILFVDCNNDTVLHCAQTADVLMTAKETRTSFITATKQALEIFDHYRYRYAGGDSVSALVQPGDGGDSILWNPGIKLTWDDFKGSAKAGEPADALTYTSNQTKFASFGIGSRFEVESEVHCYFIKSKSWVKAGMQVDYLLNHEQRHFDLAEAGAREFRKRLKEAKFTAQNFRDLVKSITNNINEKYFKLQDQYDEETDHSRIQEKQLEWNKKIDGMLKALEAYK